MFEQTDAMNCFLVNGILEGNEKKYIYGLNENTGKLFFWLCSLGIEIEGFVAGSKHDCGMVFQKKVYSLEQIESMEDAVVLTVEECVNIQNAVRCNIPITLNEGLKCKKIYLYGSGNVGRCVKHFLSENGIEITGFIDSDNRKVGRKIEGTTVYGKDIISSLDENASIVCCGRYWKQMDKAIMEMNDKVLRFYESGEYIWNYEKPTSIVIDAENAKYMPARNSYELGECFAGKTVVLYGEDVDEIACYANKFKLFGFEDIILAVDKADVKKTKAYEVIDITDVLYLENYVVVLQDIAKEYRLIELGLKKTIDYTYLQFFCGVGVYRKMRLDINLGYTYDAKHKNSLYPGIDLYGESKEDDFKIAILGGSTTDGGYNVFPSWSEKMYNRYLDRKVTIYNCGISGYHSGQELTKMIRDVLTLKPDMIISYSGYNDVTRTGHASYVLGVEYLYSLFDELKNQMGEVVETGVCCGVETPKNGFELWLDNMQYMKIIADLNGIQFLAFLQPTLIGKKTYNRHEQQMYNASKIFYSEMDLKKLALLREKATEVAKQNSFIHDLSHIFDEEDVYMDLCHVYERGNEIIADNIWETIKDKIPNEYRRG